MGFGIPFNFADATFAFTSTGDGLNFNYVYRPVSQQSFVAWSPPGALTTQSALYHNPVNVPSAQAFTVATGAQINALLPWSASYLVLQPPLTSQVAKTMKGAGGDVGINLIPWLPLILALPNPLPNAWQLIVNYGGPEDADLYLF